MSRGYTERKDLEEAWRRARTPEVKSILLGRILDCQNNERWYVQWRQRAYAPPPPVPLTRWQRVQAWVRKNWWLA